MLIASQNKNVIQTVTIMVLRQRAQTVQGGGIFYHTPTRTEAIVPIDPLLWHDPRYAAFSQLGLRSQIGTTFSPEAIPYGCKTEEVYTVVGTVVDTPTLRVHLTGSDEFETLDPSALETTASMEILKSDLIRLQEQQQNALLLTSTGFVQFNAQDYGEGLDAEGRDRQLLQGSIWVTPQYYSIEWSRPQQRSAAGSREEVREMAERAALRNNQRRMSARLEAFANRATRDENRALKPMPPRRGSNIGMADLYSQGQHTGVGVTNVPYAE